jgi:hypothetical protein
MDENTTPNKSFQDVINAPEIVWLGIDFSRVKFIGPAGFNDLQSILTSQIHGINDVVIKENHKFDFQKFLRKRPRYKAEQVYMHNMNINPAGIVLVVDQGNRVDGSMVQDVVNECQFPAENAIGLMFVTESLDKNQAAAFAWVAFVDLATSKVIATSKYAGRAGGITFRNYWANAFFDIIRQLSHIVR